MNYEKAYNEALERAKKWYYAPNADKIPTYANRVIEEIFPELKESEDEKIRKGIIDFLWKEKIFLQEAHSSVENNPKYRFVMDAIAWLEKQKSVGEIVERCKNSWYNEGKIAGMAEGLTDDEKYQQGWHDALEKQGEQNPVNDTVETIVEAVSNTSILDMIEDKDAFTNPGAFENSLGRLLKLFEKLPKQDLLDGLKFYANVVEHDGEYVKPATWSEDDERIVTALMEGFRYHQLFNPRFGEVPNAEIIAWIKSLKERLI